MIPIFLAMCLSANSEWSVEYTITEDGPYTLYEGTSWVHGSHSEFACFRYTFPGTGVLTSGGKMFIEPRILPFQQWIQDENGITGEHCAWWGLSDWQSHPHHFKFAFLRTNYNSDDIAELLTQWDSHGSWDLNRDGNVDGFDLALLMHGYVSS